jgi:hypothetical protein
VDCEEITTKILELAKSIFHDDQPEIDDEGFVKVWGEDWSDIVSYLEDLAEVEDMGRHEH